MKILYFTKYTRKGASSRLRSYQYFPYLEKQGIEVTVSPFFCDAYLENLYAKKSTLKQVIKAYFHRFFSLWKVCKYDRILIEYELFPYLPGWFEFIYKLFNIKYIVDYDDAIFHNYDLHPNQVIRFLLKNKIDQIMKNSYCVVVGNSYLKERAVFSGAKNIRLMPTVIDVNRYLIKEKKENKNFVIGWIGSDTTFKYVKNIVPILKQLIEKYHIFIHIVGASESLELGNNEKHLDWLEETEVQSILTFDVGIMPLLDTPWEQGKCGYKLIQYMGCGLPIVASAVGANNDIVEHGLNGFLVNSEQEWFDYIEQYILDPELRKNHRSYGRSLVENKYCIEKQLDIYKEIYEPLNKR
ncbi:hypothetical protein EZS27_025835 [termite gut metagenome]|uniref:Uncharacterized protein n=1 Tax=termite gut metagenome TaxID=433724 RepID=A0A5J4QUR2_9ZZZZ